jgi:hypothetical protein
LTDHTEEEVKCILQKKVMQIWNMSSCYRTFSHFRQNATKRSIITHRRLPFLNKDNKRGGGHERISDNQALTFHETTLNRQSVIPALQTDANTKAQGQEREKKH